MEFDCPCCIREEFAVGHPCNRVGFGMGNCVCFVFHAIAGVNDEINDNFLIDDVRRGLALDPASY